MGRPERSQHPAGRETRLLARGLWARVCGGAPEMEPEPEAQLGSISPPDPRRDAYDFVRRGPYLGDSAEIGASELDIALQRIGIKLDEAEVAAIIAERDQCKTGTIGFDDFAATIEDDAVDAARTERIISLLGGDKPDRTEAYSLLDSLAVRGATAGGGHDGNAAQEGSWERLQAHAVAVGEALRCIEPLWRLQTLPVGEVDAQEFCRVGLLCAALGHIDHRRVAAEFCKYWGAVWKAQDSAHGVVLAKSPADITADDVLVLACHLAPFPENWQLMVTEMCKQAGVENEMIFLDGQPYLGNHGDPVVEARFARVSELAQQLLQDTDLPLDSEWVRPGLCLLCAWSTVGRPEVSKALVQSGYMEWSVASLGSQPATEWIVCGGSQTTAFPMGVFWCLKDATSDSKAVGVDLEGRALKCGAVDLCLAALSAYEELGVGPQINQGAVGYATWFLSSLDYRTHDALRNKVRSKLSALKFILAHPHPVIQATGAQTVSHLHENCSTGSGYR
eukprot:COSAG02_NODE_1004_length_15275_cov_11.955917_11_plen_506_part_00